MWTGTLTNVGPILVELYHCRYDEACLIVRSYAVQERYSRQCVPVPVALKNISMSKMMTPHRPPFTVDILFDGWCLPDLLIILSNIKVGVAVKSILYHKVIKLQLQILVNRRKQK